MSGGDLFVATYNGTVGEYTTAGGTVNASLITGLSQPYGIAVSGGDLFVAEPDNGTVGEYTTAGTTLNAAFDYRTSFPVQAIAVSGGNLYVANAGNQPGTTTAGAYAIGRRPPAAPGPKPTPSRRKTNLKITKTDNLGGSSVTGVSGTAHPGQTITYTIVASNTGPSDMHRTLRLSTRCPELARRRNVHGLGNRRRKRLHQGLRQHRRYDVTCPAAARSPIRSTQPSQFSADRHTVEHGHVDSGRRSMPRS